MSSAPPVHFELSFQLTPRDLRKASRTITRNMLGKSWYVWGILSPLLVFGALYFVVAQALGVGAPVQVNGVWRMLILPAIFFYFYFVAPHLTARSILKQSANLRSAIHYTISDDGITQEAATSQSQLGWATYIKAQETKDFFLLYMRKSMAHSIPKRAFASADEISQFREMLRRHVKNVSLRPTS